ncbi:MAG: deoxyribodipyrimidine photo-lyase [Methylophagaceae bacterium]|jgi:deoxyribodipyrimidine photo-lyase
MQIVWFKRDLRLHDHAALAMASNNGPCIPLYILEPALWHQADMSQRQYQFLNDCLSELDIELRNIGQQLVIRVGDAVTILQAISEQYAITGLWSHQETWNGWTYARDKRVKRWASSHAIPWHQPVQNGVIRRLRTRNGWAAKWYSQMERPLIAAPVQLSKIICHSDTLPTSAVLGLKTDGYRVKQQGGRLEALSLLASFLEERGEGYTKEMSSPVTAFDSCSRLSSHLAFGTLSMREVVHAVEARHQHIKSYPSASRGKWPSSIRSFSGRLRWHCHFIQKLEDEPRLEFENLHSGYDGLREDEFNTSHFEAWKAGETGYPMIDACMRALIATGWINFRMRAMLASFASFHLWLHWRQPALHLGRLFVDYEPGIHYSQMQMQSGTTGINSIRIYNPIKQGVDHDPEGRFIQSWIPELQNMPKEYIHRPWELPEKMNGYPLPIIDEKKARQFAADKIYSLRKKSKHTQETEKIIIKHASRKRTINRKKPATVSKKDNNTDQPTQGVLPF